MIGADTARLCMVPLSPDENKDVKRSVVCCLCHHKLAGFFWNDKTKKIYVLSIAAGKKTRDGKLWKTFLIIDLYITTCSVILPNYS